MRRNPIAVRRTDGNNRVTASLALTLPQVMTKWVEP
jgi:adenylosuccinate lyase